jgi:hypothetical protein
LRFFFREPQYDNDSLFTKIHAYLKRVNALEQRALQTEYCLKCVLQVLTAKVMNETEFQIFERAVMHAEGLERERYAIQTKAK